MGYSIDSIYTTNYTLFKLAKNDDVSINYFLTADVSDVYLDELNDIKKKRYLNSRAEFYINPYNNCTNSINKFNNDKEIFREKNILQMRCNSCTNNSTSHNNEHRQRIIQNQVRVMGSLYTMNLGSLTSGNSTKNNKPWNNSSDRYYNYNLSKNKNKGVDIKHNSYDRYLNRKKSHNLKTEKDKESVINPLYGNKTIKFGLIKNSNCLLDC